MKNTFLLITGIFLMIVVLLSSCKKDNTDSSSPLEGLIKLKEGYASGASAKVEIWGKKNFFSGYNQLTVVLYDSVNPAVKLTDAHIHFEPVMTMMMGGMMKVHSSPVENPDETAVNDVFPGAVDFIMPSTMDGNWVLNVEVHNHKVDLSGTASFDITVDTPDQTLCKSFISQSSDSSKLFITITKPVAPVVGVNDLEFTIHKMADMMNFEAMDDYTIEITPEMPSMGHGSPNNVNPVNSGNGHYSGKVNFTMTGDWRINVIVKKNGTAVSNNLYFDLTL